MTMPPCFYPTTVCVVDDDIGFVNNLVRTLDKARSRFTTFTSPKEAVLSLNTHPQNQFLEQFTQQSIKRKGNMDFEDVGIYDLRGIHNHPTRSQDISVVVLDFDMPGMNGLELSQAITNPHIKKILLTGVTDEKNAIEAFHAGHIHAYVRKNDIHFLNKLESHIYRLQLDYFREVFMPITNMLQQWHNVISPLPFFTSEYTALLENLIHTSRASEYYLCDHTGTAQCIDAQGVTHDFIVRSQEDFEDIRHFSAYEALCEEDIADLERHDVILCNDWKHEHINSYDYWVQQIRPANRVESTPPFWWYSEKNLLTQPAGNYLSD